MAARKTAARKKTGGRKKGTPNKVGADLRQLAQQYTEMALAALVAALNDPMQSVAAAKIILAYGHGAPRAAVDVSIKPVYVMSAQPMSPEEWAQKYADDSASDGIEPIQPVAEPKPSRAGVGAPARPPKRAGGVRPPRGVLRGSKRRRKD
jgi:hypothetical protein